MKPEPVQIKTVEIQPSNNNKKIEKPSDLVTPEMVIGLCCPIGSPAKEVASQIQTQLFQDYDYETKIIKLSKTIEHIMDTYSVNEKSDDGDSSNNRFWIRDHVNSELKKHDGQSQSFINKKKLILAGNKIRSEFESLSPLASHAVKEISEARIENINAIIDEDSNLQNIEKTRIKKEIQTELQKSNNIDELNPDFQVYVKKALIVPARRCFIIDSLKNKEELKLLRETYGRTFFLVGVSSSIEDRKSNLTNEGMTGAEFEMLVSQDTGEDIEEGQNVSEIFCESDYFMRVKDHETNRITKVSRMLKVLFDSSLVTPNKHETAMYQAASAAGNSACMSRQVGAAIADKSGELISIGWNDVPRYGGNLYRTENEVHDFTGQSIELTDSRCFNWGNLDCHNDLEKDRNAKIIAEDLFENLLNNNLLDGDVNKTQIIDQTTESIRKHPKFKNLLEFSRSIHAEMHAILSADREKLVKSSLYCTTYPCHSCARHIVAAGIEEVFYIEPYRKSLALKLHSDSITEGDKIEKVKILVFEGVAPRRYMDLFNNPNNRSRKKDGKLRKVDNKNAVPSICQTTLASVSALEHVVIHSLHDKEARLTRQSIID